MLSTRQLTTAHTISVCAQRLTDDHGLDGFTMEDLAEAAGVSRRTLFNYFPGKLDAVLGPGPDMDNEILREFRAGGPTGHLMDDVESVLLKVLSVKAFDAKEAEVLRRIIRDSPRLHEAVQERFRGAVELFSDILIEREGEDFGVFAARVLVRTMAGLCDTAVDEALARPGNAEATDIGALCIEALHTLRRVLA